MNSTQLDALQPKDSESLLGYLRRIGRAKAHFSTADFYVELGIGYGRRLIEEIGNIEQQLGLSENTLARIAPASPPKDTCRDWHFERHHSDPVCPQCLAENKPYQAHWRHALASACFEHGVRLVDKCPCCAEHLIPRSGGFCLCTCGFSLDRLPQNQAPLHECMISSLIAGTNSIHSSEILRANVPVDIGRFVHFLASGFQQNRSGKAGKTRVPKTVEETVLLLDPVAPLFANWPHGFEEYVRLQLAAGDPEKNSAPARLGNWYQRLMQFKDPAYDPFKEAVGRVIQREFNGSYVGSLAPKEQREWLSAKEAASHLGITAQRLVETVQKGEVAGKQTRSGYGHQHTVVPNFEVSVIKADRQRFWDGRKTAGFLGVSRKQFDLLKDAGLIVEVAPVDRPPLVDGGFDGVAIKASIESIRSQAASSIDRTICFRELTLRLTTDRTALLKLFHKIFGGEVRATRAETEASLAEFQFSRSTVEDVLRTERHSLDWTANDVAKLTGWKAQSVTYWCKEGLLDARTVPHGNGVSYLISPINLATFQSLYVPVVTLAKAQGTTSRKLLADFANRNIPTYGAEQEGKTSRGHLVKLMDLIFFERPASIAA